MRSFPVGLVALAAGLVTGFGVGRYEAWWTIAIAIGGAAIAIQEWRGRTAGRALAMGTGVAIAMLLGGMSLFLLFGSFVGGGTAWFAASAASLVASIGLLVILGRSSSSVPRTG
jgi:hypothetical protein